MKNTLFFILALMGFVQLSAETFNETNNQDTVPQNQNVQIIPKVDLHQKGALTFYWGSGSSVIQKQIADKIYESIKFDYPNVKMIIEGPSAIGYQYHVKDKVSIGMVYSGSNVKTSDLSMPNLQNPGDSTIFYYNVGLNTLFMQIDWFWGKIKRPKSTWSFHSGIGLGVFSVNISTELKKGTGASVQQIQNSVSTSGFQLTAIGVKHTMNALKGFGWFANLGAGMNSVGFTTGINYTL